jgi:hypothetical protein
VGGRVFTAWRKSVTFSSELLNRGGIGVDVEVGVVKKVTPCRATIVRTASVCSKPGTIVAVGAVVQAVTKETTKPTAIIVRLRIQILLISNYH